MKNTKLLPSERIGTAILCSRAPELANRQECLFLRQRLVKKYWDLFDASHHRIGGFNSPAHAQDWCQANSYRLVIQS